METGSAEREVSLPVLELVLSEAECSTVAWERLRSQSNNTLPVDLV